MTLKEWLKKAQSERFAIGQFNFSTFEQLGAIIESSLKLASPVIVGVSRGEVDFLGMWQVVWQIRAFREQLKEETGREWPIFLNLDHARDPKIIKKAIELGFDSVHFDGSYLPFKENIEKTKEIVLLAHRKNVLVEGEFDPLGTQASKIYPGKFLIKREQLTDPEKAEKFVRKTKIDSFAGNFGTFHGIQAEGENPEIQLEILKKVRERIGKTFLVLHGGSGTPEDNLKKAIQLGIVKINVNTELRIAWRKALENSLQKLKEELAPYKILALPKIKVAQVVEKKIKLFGSDQKVF